MQSSKTKLVFYSHSLRTTNWSRYGGMVSTLSQLWQLKLQFWNTVEVRLMNFYTLFLKIRLMKVESCILMVGFETEKSYDSSETNMYSTSIFYLQEIHAITAISTIIIDQRNLKQVSKDNNVVTIFRGSSRM